MSIGLAFGLIRFLGQGVLFPSDLEHLAPRAGALQGPGAIDLPGLGRAGSNPPSRLYGRGKCEVRMRNAGTLAKATLYRLRYSEILGTFKLDSRATDWQNVLL